MLGNVTAASVRYIEINVFGNQYRLLPKTLGAFSSAIFFTVNGIQRSSPYLEAIGINVVLMGGKLVFSTTFGLTVTWDGMGSATETLCDAYARHVCGLCGNADGIIFDLIDSILKK
jgi:hypothetical protein